MGVDKRLFLLDGNALVYRAHFAFINRPLISSKGINTSAIAGFLRSLWDLIKNEKPTHLAVSFDKDGPTFRHKMYGDYKANREAQPEDIKVAMPYIMKLVQAFRIPILTLDGYEADDIIGTLAKKAEKRGYTVYMVTPDKDFAQLVSNRIFLYKPSRQGNGVEVLGPKEIMESWGISRVDQVVDVLGLKGDSVDNIPGIPGIGDKTASKLLEKFETVENLVAHAHEVEGKIKENIIQYADQGLLSKKLAIIDTAAPVEFDDEALILEPFDKPALRELFKELEFRALALAILGEDETDHGPVMQMDLFGRPVAAPKSKEKPETERAYSVADKDIKNTHHDYKILQTDQEYLQLAKALEKSGGFCVDTETTDLDPLLAKLVGISFSFDVGKAYYIPIPENDQEAHHILNFFKALLENPSIPKTGQNVKYDYLIFKVYDITLAGVFYDTMIAHYLLEPDHRHKLDILSETYLNYKMIPIEDLIGKGAKQLSMRDVSTLKAAEYAAEDADVTWQLKDILFKKLDELELDDLYFKLESPLIAVLADMEYEGIRINPDLLQAYSLDLSKLILKLEQSIYLQAGTDFNIASPRQVGEILFDKLRIPYRWRKTQTGQYSTDEEKLSELANDFKIVYDIQEHRKLSKLKSTYVDTLPLLINPRTGRVHTSFNQARAATGRLSSENPNLQNIPIRDEAGREIRKAFVPRNNDFILCSADYSQIELRLIAALSKEEAMLEAFRLDQDIHRATASKVYGVPIEEVTAEQRRNAKTVNFSIIYGAGSVNLSRQLNIKRTEAKEIIDNYFKQYKGLRNYMDQTVTFARQHGYVSTLLGRRRYLRDINSRNSLARSNAERMAINTPIQGTAADMIKVAMINIHAELLQKNLKSKMILQVHDELLFDVFESEFEELKTLVNLHLKNAIPGLDVPIEVGIGAGKNWLEAH